MRRLCFLFLTAILLAGFKADAQTEGEDLADALASWISWVECYDWGLDLLGIDPSDDDEVSETDTIMLSDAENKILEAIVLRELWFEKIKENNAQMKKHLVEKGEDWESIAAIYGLTKGDLTSANPFVDDCYAGMEIDVPVFLSELQIRENRLNQTDAGYILAKENYDAGNYKKALKIYDEIEKSGKSTLLSRYNRGLCCMRVGKYGKCVSDMEYVISNDSDNSYPNAKQIRDRANNAIEERNRRRAEMVGAMLQTAANAYGQYAYTKQMQEWQQNGISPSGEIVDPSKLSKEYRDKLLDPNFAIQQYQAKEFQEYQTFGRHFKKPDGSNYSFQEWKMLKTQAEMEMNGSGNNVGLGNDSSSESVSPSNFTTYGRENYEADCHICHGTGRCPTCYSGVASGFGLNFACPNCKAHPGKCSTCHGTGKVTKVRTVEIQH